MPSRFDLANGSKFYALLAGLGFLFSLISNYVPFYVWALIGIILLAVFFLLERWTLGWNKSDRKSAHEAYRRFTFSAQLIGLFVGFLASLLLMMFHPELRIKRISPMFNICVAWLCGAAYARWKLLTDPEFSKLES